MKEEQRQRLFEKENPKFEIGKYYEHTTGKTIHILGEIETTMWGKCFVGETNYSELESVGMHFGAATNYSEITKQEWMKGFKI